MPKGAKVCPACGLRQGPRSLICECGHKFEKKIKPEPKRKRKTISDKQREEYKQLLIADEIKKNGGYPLIYTPAGSCPCKLENTTVEAVTLWYEELCNTIRRIGETSYKFSTEAIIHFIGQFYSPDSEEYATVKGIIESLGE